MTLDEFIDHLYFMPAAFVPIRVGDKLAYWVGGREVGIVEAVWMFKFQKSIKPCWIDAVNALNLSHPDAARLSNAENFKFLSEWFYGLDTVRLRVDIECGMWKGKL